MHGGDPPRITSHNLQETCLNLRKLRQPSDVLHGGTTVLASSDGTGGVGTERLTIPVPRLLWNVGRMCN